MPAGKLLDALEYFKTEVFFMFQKLKRAETQSGNGDRNVEKVKKISMMEDGEGKLLHAVERADQNHNY